MNSYNTLTRFFHNRNMFYGVRSLSIRSAKKLPKDLAMEHFDDFYGVHFGKSWPSVRLGLLCPHKYCAVINPFAEKDLALRNFDALKVKNLQNIYNRRLVKSLRQSSPNMNVSVSATESDEEYFDDETVLPESEITEDMRSTIDSFVPASDMRYQEEVITESEYFQFYQGESLSINIEKELVPFPRNWNVMILPRGDLSRFPVPPKDQFGLFAYYLLDGASLLPVWALNISVGNEVADLCAAPGGKALAAVYTFCPKSILCNDVSKSRMNRLRQVFQSYVPDIKDKIEITLMESDAREIHELDGFDRILLDVPCTNDRMSSIKDENSIFKPTRMKERVTLPQLQSELLSAALKLLKVEGSLVYSTCSLSPMQNDGVVHVALQKLWKETSKDFVIKDLTDTFKPLDGIFRFHYSCKYGLLVLPFVPCNFGPMYISKITRKK